MFFGSLPAGLVSRFRRAGQLAVSADHDLFGEDLVRDILSPLLTGAAVTA